MRIQGSAILRALSVVALLAVMALGWLGQISIPVMIGGIVISCILGILAERGWQNALAQRQVTLS